MVPGREHPEDVESVVRALGVLETLGASATGMGISEISAATAMPVGTVHRMLGTLVRHGYAVQDPSTRRYALGHKLWTVAAASHNELGARARPYLTRLMEVTQETANLAVFDRDRATYVEQVSPPRTLLISVRPGTHAPLHASGSGKVLLAYQPAKVAETLLRREPLPVLTPHTTTDPDDVLSELRAAREQGYAQDLDEREEGVRCVAAPVLARDGSVVAAVSISGPAQRLTDERVRAAIPRVKGISANLSKTLHEPG